MSRKTIGAAVLAAACATALAACTDTDTWSTAVHTLPARPLVTSPPVTTHSVTTVPPTTAPAVSTTIAPTTEPTPPTTPAPPSTLVAGGTPEEEALAAQIAADYAAGLQLLSELEAHPTLDGLDGRLAQFSAPDSPFYVQIAEVLNLLVAEQQVIVPNEPPVDTVVVETVIFRGEPPYQAADVLVCEANNLRRVTPAQNSPTGTEIVHSDEGLLALRRWVVLVPSATRWVRYDDNTDFVDNFEGQSTCTPR